MEALDTEAGTVHLRLSRPARIDLETARQRLDAAAWLGFEIDIDARRHLSETATQDVPGIRRYETDLGLPLRPGSQRTIFRKAALVDLGAPETTAKGLHVPIASAGLVVDRAFLNLAARGTARWFLDRIGEAIETPGAIAQPPQGAR